MYKNEADIVSDYSLTVNQKYRITSILQRHLGKELCVLCSDLIEEIIGNTMHDPALSEMDDKINELERDINDAKYNMYDDIASEVKCQLSEAVNQIKDKIDTINDLGSDLGEIRRTRESISSTVHNFSEMIIRLSNTIDSLLNYLDKKKKINLRQEEERKPRFNSSTLNSLKDELDSASTRLRSHT